MFKRNQSFVNHVKQKYKRMKSVDSYALSGEWHDKYEKVY